MHPLTSFRGVFVLAIGLAAISSTERAIAQTSGTWTGGGGADGSWSSSANWGGTLPTAGDLTTLTFNATSGTKILNQDLGNPFILNALTFNRTAPTATFSITGNALQFSGNNATILFQGVGGGAGSITDTIGTDIIIGGDNLSIVSTSTSSNVLRITGNISTTNLGLTTLTLGGSHTGANTIVGTISNGTGTIGINKTEAGLWNLFGTNTFSGNITVQAGFLRFNSLAGLGNSAEITFGNLSNSAGILSYTVGASAIELSQTFNLSGTGVGIISNDSATVTSTIAVTGPVTALDAGNKTLGIGGVNLGLNDFKTLLTNVGSTAIGIQKAGAGTWIVSNTGNSFTGGVTIVGGQLRADDITTQLNFNATGNNLRFAAAVGTVAVLEKSGTFTANIGTGAGEVQWAGNGASGGFSAFGGAFDITLNNDAVTPLDWNTTTTLGGFITRTGELQLNSPLSDNIVTLHNAINLSGANRQIRVTDNLTSANDWAVMSGTLSGGGIAKLGNGALVLTGVNSFSEGITLNGGSLRVDDVNLNLNLANNNLVFNSTNGTIAGVLETMGSLTNDIGTGAGQLRWTLTGAGGFSAFGGALSLTLNNDAATPLVWGGTADFVAGGKELLLSYTSANNVVTLNNALDLNGITQTIRVLNNPFEEGDYAVLSGTISNGALLKQGTGTLMLSGNNSFAGGFTLAQGALIVGSNDALGTGTLALLSGSAVVSNLDLTSAASVTFTGASITFTGTGSLAFNSVNPNSVLVALTLTNYLSSLTFSNETLLAANVSTTTGNLVAFRGGLGVIGGNRQVTVNNAGGVIVGDVNLASDGLAHTLTFSVAANRSLVIDGDIFDGGAGSAITITAATGSSVTLNGATTITGAGILGGGGVYTFGNDNALGTANWTTLNTPIFRADVGPRSVAGNITLSGNLVLAGTETLALGGTITVSGANRQISTSNTTVNNILGGTVILGDAAAARTLTLVGTAGSTLLVNSTFTDGPTAGGSVYYGVAGFFVGGNSAYTGNTTIASGSVEIGHNNAFGSSVLTVTSGTLIVNAPRVLANNVNLGGAISFSGDGTLAFNGPGANAVLASTTLTNNLAALTFSNEVVLSNNLSITLGNLINFAGGLGVAGADRTFLVYNIGGAAIGDVNLAADGAPHGLILRPNTGISVTLNGVISDGGLGGNITLSSGAGGTITLNGVSTYSGISTLQGSGNIVVGNNAAFGNSVVNIISTPLLQADASPRTLTNDFNLLGNLVLAGTETLALGGTITVSGANRQISTSNTTVNNILGGTVILGDAAAARTLTLVGTAGSTLLVNSTFTDGPTAGGSVYYGVAGFFVGGNSAYTGNTTIASGSVEIGHNNAFGSSVLTVTSGTLIVNAPRVLANNVNLGGAISFSGDGTLAFNGPGANAVLASTTLTNNLAALTFSNELTLLGNVAFAGVSTINVAGAMTVSGGNRQISNSNGSVLQLGAIVLGDAASARTLTLGGNALTSTGIIQGVISDGAVAGGAVGVASGNWIFNNANTYSGPTSLTGGVLSLDHAGALGTSLLAVTGGTLQAGPSGPVTITNDVALLGTLTLSGPNALTLNGVTTASAARTIVTLGAAQHVINNLVGAPSPAPFAFTFGGTGNVLLNSIAPQSTTQISVVISNTSGGTVIFAQDMTYTGTSAVTTTIGAGGRLQLGNGGASGMVAGNIASSGTVIFNRSDMLTFNPVISGVGGVTLAGAAAGGVLFQNAQLFTGSVSLDSGTLQYGVANAVPITNNFLINSTGTLDLNGFAGGITTLSEGISGGGVITSGAAGGLLTVTQGYYSGTIGGGSNMSFQKGNLAAGVLTLSGNNDFSGTSTLAGGTLFVGTNSAIGTGTWYVMGGALGGTGGARSFANDFVLAGTTTLTTGADLTFNGVITMSTPALVFTNANTNQTTTFGSIVLTSITATSATTTFNFADNATTVFGGEISQGTGTRAIVTFTGQTTGTGAMVTLLAANTYTGVTNVGGNVTLSLAGNDRLAANMTLTLQNNAVLALGGSQTLTSLFGVATTLVTNSSGTDVVITLSGGNYGGIIQDGNGSVSINKLFNAATLTLAGNNTYSGTTTVGSGILALGSGGATGEVAGDIVLSGTGAIVWNRSNAVAYAGNITATSGSDTGTGGITFTGGGSFDLQGTTRWIGNTVVGGNTTLTLNGSTILGTGAISIANNGSAVTGGVMHVLAGAQIGTGAISLSSGSTLDFNGTQGTSNAQSSAVTLTNASILMGSGSFLSGNVTANNGSDIFIGTNGTVSTLTLRNLILAGGNLNFDLGATTDLLRVTTTGSITAPSAINLNILGGFAGEGTYDLITGLSSPLSGTGFITLVGANAYIRTLQFNGNDLQLVLTSATTKTWSGSLSNIWDVATTQNFTDSNSNAAGYNNAETVRFVDGAANTDITLSNNGSPLFPNAVLVDNSLTTTYTFNGDPLGGATGIDKRGIGLLVLANENTFTGAINVSGGGTLQIGNGGTIGSITPTLEIGLDGNSTLIFNRSDAISQSGGISGSGNLVKSGPGVLTIWGTNSYTGLTTIDGGTLQTMSLGDLASANDYNVIGGTLSINGSVNQVIKSTITVSNGGLLNVVSASLTTSTLILNNGSLNISKTLTTPFAQILGGSTVNVNNTSGLVASKYSFWDGSINVNVDSTMSTLTIFGGGGAGSQAVLNIASGTTLTIAGNLLFDATGDPLGAIINGPGLLSLGVSTARSITVADSAGADNDLTIAAVLSASSSFIKAGNGTLYLTGVNLLVNTNSLTAGTLKVSSSSALGSGQLNITGTSAVTSISASILSADGSPQTISNSIGLLGGFAISGTQNLTLAGTITQSAAGRTIAFNSTGSGVGIINDLVLSETTSGFRTITFAGDSRGIVHSIADAVGTTTPNGIIVNGAGLSLTLDNANSYGGATTLIDGSVFIGNAGSLGTTNNTVTTLTLGAVGVGVINPSLLTTAGITFTRNINVIANTNAASIITLGGATTESSAFTGDVNFSAASGLYLSAVTGGTVVFSGNLAQSTLTSGGITKTGSGTVILTGNTTYINTTTVATSVLQGTLRVGSVGAMAGTPVLAVDLNGTLDLNGFDASVTTLTNGPNGGGSIISATPAQLNAGDGLFSGVIGGAVSLNKISAGTLVLDGTNTYSGTTMISAGTLQIGSGAAGSITSQTVVNNGALVFNRSNAYSYAGQISGTGSVTVSGGGTITLAGDNSYTGATSVASGTLNVTGTLGNTAVAVASGATLAGTGTIFGTVTSLGAIAPGTLGTVGTMTLGGLVLGGGSLNFDLGSSLASDMLRLSGGSFNLTATTGLNLAPLSGFGAGTYDLISGFTGAIGGFDFLSTPSTLLGYNLTLTDAGGVLRLLVSGTGGSSQDLTWAGGSGTWGSSNYAGGATYADGDDVTFNDSPGTSTVSIAGGGVAPGAVTVNNNLGNTYVFTGGPITGTATLNKLGAGALVLASDNTYTGPTTVAAGSLEVRGAFASSNVTVSGGLIFNPGSGNQTINGVVAGNGTLQKLGSGTTTLGGNNTFNGPTAVDAGRLVVGNASTLSGTVTVNNATFVANGDVRGLVNVNAGGVLHGNGSVGAVVLQSGGILSVGNSVGSLTIDGDNAGGPSLTLNAGSIIEFEFNNVSGGPGVGWDYLELGGGLLTINATNNGPNDQVEVHVNSLTLNGSAHGANNFNAAAGTPGSIQEYYWKFIGLNNLSQISTTGSSSVGGRFQVIDDLVGAGVFDTTDGNPYDRPLSSLGQGTFKVLAGDFGQGTGLYIYYSAVPEPGSMLLAGLGSIAAGWYGRRKLRRKQNDAAAMASEPIPSM